jgi:hypothetical protein
MVATRPRGGLLLFALVAITALTPPAAAGEAAAANEPRPSGDALKGTRAYDDYERPQACRQCHPEIFAGIGAEPHGGPVRRKRSAVQERDAPDPRIVHALQAQTRRVHWFASDLVDASDVDPLAYHSTTLHASWLLGRNARLVAEYTFVLEDAGRENGHRASVGVISAF